MRYVTGSRAAIFYAHYRNASNGSASQFCNATLDCQAKFGDGTPCVNDVECATGCCGAFICGGLGC